MRYLQCDDQTDEQYSRIWQTYVTHALITDAFRERKHFTIKLHLDIALRTVRAMCLSDFKRLSTVIPRSRIESTNGNAQPLT